MLVRIRNESIWETLQTSGFSNGHAPAGWADYGDLDNGDEGRSAIGAVDTETGWTLLHEGIPSGVKGVAALPFHFSHGGSDMDEIVVSREPTIDEPLIVPIQLIVLANEIFLPIGHVVLGRKLEPFRPDRKTDDSFADPLVELVPHVDFGDFLR